MQFRNGKRMDPKEDAMVMSFAVLCIQKLRRDTSKNSEKMAKNVTSARWVGLDLKQRAST